MILIAMSDYIKKTGLKQPNSIFQGARKSNKLSPNLTEKANNRD